MTSEVLATPWISGQVCEPAGRDFGEKERECSLRISAYCVAYGLSHPLEDRNSIFKSFHSKVVLRSSPRENYSIL